MLSPASYLTGLFVRMAIVFPVVAVALYGGVPLDLGVSVPVLYAIILAWHAALMFLGYLLLRFCCNIAGTGYFAEIEAGGVIGLHHSLWGPKLNSKKGVSNLNRALAIVLQHNRRQRPIVVLSPALQNERRLGVLAALVSRNHPGHSVEIVRNVMINPLTAIMFSLRHRHGSGEWKWVSQKNGIRIKPNPSSLLLERM